MALNAKQEKLLDEARAKLDQHRDNPALRWYFQRRVEQFERWQRTESKVASATTKSD